MLTTLYDSIQDLQNLACSDFLQNLPAYVPEEINEQEYPMFKDIVVECTDTGHSQRFSNIRIPLQGEFIACDLLID